MARRTGLGRGLESLIGEANAEANVATPHSTLPLSRIEPHKGQPRKNFDQEALEELADSIRKNGILQPLLVREKGDHYEIVAGERRYQAAKKAGIEEVPVIVREVSDDEVLQLALIENLQRADLNPIEEAQGFKALLDTKGLTQDQLGRILSKSRPAIANTLRLLDLPKRVQDLMAEGRLTAGHARAILSVATEGGRIRLAEKVVTDKLTVRQTETLAPLFSGSGSTQTHRVPTPQSFKRAARQLRLALDTNVRVKRVRNKNRIEIEFADEEELTHLVRILSRVGTEDEGR